MHIKNLSIALIAKNRQLNFFNSLPQMMQNTLPSSSEQIYSFEANVICLGENCKKPWIRYQFDGRRLSCWLSGWYYTRVLITGALVGPGVTALLLLGKINNIPWYMWLLMILISCIAWLGFIGALWQRYQIVVDLVSKKAMFLVGPIGEPKYVLDLKDVDGIFVEKIRRQKNRSSLIASRIDERMAKKIATVMCYGLGLMTKRGKAIYLLETTDESVVQEIKQILDDQLEMQFT